MMQEPFSVAPCQTLELRFEAALASLYGAHVCGRAGEWQGWALEDAEVTMLREMVFTMRERVSETSLPTKIISEIMFAQQV